MRNYLAGSVFAAIVVIWHAFTTRQQFFPSVAYLSSSKLSVAVLGNLGFAMALSTYKILTWTFLGRLRDSEVERINDKVSQAIIETLLAMTIFRQDFTVGFFAAFVILSFVKIFHWMIQDRVDFIETTPNVTRSQHIRIVAFICLLIGIDYVLLHYALASTLNKGISINLLFAFEYAIQISTALTTLCKYTLSVIDMAMEGRWEGKGVAVFYLELALDLLHLITYTAFFAAVFTTYGIPIHLVRDLYWTFRNFQTRVRDFLRYRQVAAIMEHRFPDATAEDLARADHVCIVCREDMGPGSRAKKLDCSHCFHVHCLRSWLERQQNCPICRAPVLATVDTTRRNARRGAAAAAGGGGRQFEAEDNNNNNNRPAEGVAAAVPGGQHGVNAGDGAGDNDDDNGRMFDLHALLGLDDDLIDGDGGPPGPAPAGRQEAGAAAGAGLRWRGPQQQQNGNVGAARGGGGQPPLHPMQQRQQQQDFYGMYPYNIMHPQQHLHQQQYYYGYPYTPPPAFTFAQQQQMPPVAVPNGGEQNITAAAAPPASPLPQQQQQQAQNITAASAGTCANAGAEQHQQQPPQQPFMSPTFFPIPVFIPMMASPGPHTPTPGGQQQQQQATPEQHAIAAALAAAAAAAAATMSVPFMMPSPSPMPVSAQHTDVSGDASGPSSSTTPPVAREEQQQEQTQAAPPPPPPPQEDTAAAPASPSPPSTDTNTTTAPAGDCDNDDDEAEQIRRRRLERFQNGGGS